MTRAQKNSLRIAALSLASTACGRAPSVDVLGSFLPVWMLCLTVAIVATFVLHFILVKCRLDSEIGPPALFYPCAVILFTSAIWLMFYR